MGKLTQCSTLSEPGWLVQPRCGTKSVHGCLWGFWALLEMSAWPVLPSPATGPGTGLECPQEAGYLSPGGASGFPFAAPARMFCNELRESIHSGKNRGVECSLPAGVWVRGLKAACWSRVGWAWCWLSGCPFLSPQGLWPLGCFSVCKVVHLD